MLLDSEGFSRVLWTAKERPIHDVAVSPSGKLLAAAGSEGRLYEIDLAGNFAVVADVREDYILRIIQDGPAYLLAAARNGVIFTMDNRRTGEAVYESRALDARLPVRWGRFHLVALSASRQRVEAQFRVGNDGDVDSEFWSEWTGAEELAREDPLALPARPARYLQYRLTLRPRGALEDPLRVDTVEAFFREPNGAPRIDRIEIAKATERPGNQGRAASSGGSASPSPVGRQGVPTATLRRATRARGIRVRTRWCMASSGRSRIPTRMKCASRSTTAPTMRRLGS